MMILLQIKTVTLILVICCSVVNVTYIPVRSVPANEYFDFLDVLKQNEKYPPMPDACNLRIYGGVKAELGDVPYQVAIRREKYSGRVWEVFCGGAIVTEKHILTAAHCFDLTSVKQSRVIAGTIRSNAFLFGNKVTRKALLLELQNIESWRQIAKFYRHADYNSLKIQHDLAVILLDQPIEFSDTIKPIPMMKSDLSIMDDSICTTTGYGLMNAKTPSSTLRRVCVPVVPFNACKSIYYAVLFSRDTQICAGTYMKDSCQGDSGGPMACKGHLVGLVSYGGRCGEAPGVYTLLSGYTTGSKVPFSQSLKASNKVNSLLAEIILVFGTIHTVLYMQIYYS